MLRLAAEGVRRLATAAVGLTLFVVGAFAVFDTAGWAVRGGVAAVVLGALLTVASGISNSPPGEQP